MAAAEELQVEASGDTVGEAKWNALRELERLDPELDKAAVRFEVLTEGERGLLGVGYRPARVLATVGRSAAPTEPAVLDRHESELAARVRDLVEHIVGGIGLHPRVDVIEDDAAVTASCSGRDLGLLIGKHGQTIDAIQYLVNAILAHADGVRTKAVVVDAAGYRARRTASLETLALRTAERVLAGGGDVTLEPMTAVERKIVHLRLHDLAGVETASVGTEPNRSVVIRVASSVDAAQGDGAAAD
jgi:spoIIIJ-associated protein